MAAQSWPTCISFVLQFEGAYDANPKDRGNWDTGVIGRGNLKGTKYGIAAHVYPSLDIKNLTLTEAKAIYRRDYWPKVAGDHMPVGVDLVVFDMGVNGGSGRAISLLRKTLSADTSDANALAVAAARMPNHAEVVKRFSALRGSFYRSLSTFNTFGRGWMRRCNAAEAKGVVMAMAVAGASPETTRNELGKETIKADRAKTNSQGGAAATGAGAPATTAADSTWQWDWWTLGKVGVILLLVGVTVYFAHRAMFNKDRSEAFAAEAKGVK